MIADVRDIKFINMWATCNRTHTNNFQKLFLVQSNHLLVAFVDWLFFYIQYICNKSTNIIYILYIYIYNWLIEQHAKSIFIITQQFQFTYVCDLRIKTKVRVRVRKKHTITMLVINDRSYVTLWNIIRCRLQIISQIMNSWTMYKVYI